MSKRANVVKTFVAVVDCGQPVFAEEAISEKVRMQRYRRDKNAGRPFFSDSINTFLTERDSRVDGTPERRRHCRDTIAAPPHGANQPLGWE
jgi:hypothetical protein